jgi:enoyl-CoA hydratase/carnithine racemase
MSSDELLYEVASHVATITINRPERRNALAPSTMDGLLDAVNAAREDREVRVVVLTGAGDRAFCAGADLGGDLSATARTAQNRKPAGPVPQLFQAIYELGKPTIAKVRGYALAGGFGLALCCDFVLAAENAVFGSPEINVGMWPMMITVPMLRSMPAKLVLDLQLTGRRLSAREALDFGFVRQVEPDAQLDDAVEELVTLLAARSPAIVRLGRNAFYAVQDLDTDAALRYLEAGLEQVMQTADHREGVRAFREKRQPQWTGE